MAFDQLRNFPECGNALSSGATLWLVILTIKIIVSPPGQLPGHYLMSPRGRKKPTTPLSQKRSPYLWKKQNTCILKSSVAQRREKKQSKKYIYSTVLALATSARFFSLKSGVVSVGCCILLAHPPVDRREGLAGRCSAPLFGQIW